MAYMNDIDNLPEINNDDEGQEIYINWVIDRTPQNPSLFNNIIYFNNTNEYNNPNDTNEYNNPNDTNEYNNPNDNIANNNFENNNFENNNLATDDFIPFESEPYNEIVIEVQDFCISEEDCNCCVCMEMRENDTICQFNCLHKFCTECASIHYRGNRQQLSCPLCRTPVTNIYIQTEDAYQNFI